MSEKKLNVSLHWIFQSAVSDKNSAFQSEIEKKIYYYTQLQRQSHWIRLICLSEWVMTRDVTPAWPRRDCDVNSLNRLKHDFLVTERVAHTVWKSSSDLTFVLFRLFQRTFQGKSELRVRKVNEQYVVVLTAECTNEQLVRWYRRCCMCPSICRNDYASTVCCLSHGVSRSPQPAWGSKCSSEASIAVVVNIMHRSLRRPSSSFGFRNKLMQLRPFKKFYARNNFNVFARLAVMLDIPINCLGVKKTHAWTFKLATPLQ